MIEIHETHGAHKGERFRGRTLASAVRTRYGPRAAVVGSSWLTPDRTLCQHTIGTPAPRSQGAWAVRATWVVTTLETPAPDELGS